MDVNDNGPELSGGSHVRIARDQWTNQSVHFSLADRDDWSLGNGPPFMVWLDPAVSRAVAERVAVSYDQGWWGRVRSGWVRTCKIRIGGDVQDQGGWGRVRSGWVGTSRIKVGAGV